MLAAVTRLPAAVAGRLQVVPRASVPTMPTGVHIRSAHCGWDVPAPSHLQGTDLTLSCPLGGHVSVVQQSCGVRSACLVQCGTCKQRGLLCCRQAAPVGSVIATCGLGQIPSNFEVDANLSDEQYVMPFGSPEPFPLFGSSIQELPGQRRCCVVKAAPHWWSNVTDLEDASRAVEALPLRSETSAVPLPPSPVSFRILPQVDLSASRSACLHMSTARGTYWQHCQSTETATATPAARH